MKVISTEGEWIGLAHWKDCLYQVDHFSSPDDLMFGFEIIHRLIFYTSELRVIEKFKTCFKEAFGLSDTHYDLTQQLQSGSSVFWYIYWDREGFDLNLLEECEVKLNQIAEMTETRVVVLGMSIIPRSLEYINAKVNK